MFELIQRPVDALTWTAGINGEPVDWASFLDGWSAVVDFPACSAVDELANERARQEPRDIHAQ